MIGELGWRRGKAYASAWSASNQFAAVWLFVSTVRKRPWCFRVTTLKAECVHRMPLMLALDLRSQSHRFPLDSVAGLLLF